MKGISFGRVACSVVHTQEQLTQCEVDSTIEGSSDGGPLTSLLALIRTLFISHSSYQKTKPDSPCDQEPVFVQDLILLSSSLLRVFSNMSDEHPDFLYNSTAHLTFRKVKDIIIGLAQRDSDVTIHIAKRLVILKTPYSNNHSYHLWILEQLLTSFPTTFSTHLPLLVTLTSFFPIESCGSLHRTLLTFRECVCCA